jgi:hypothetical protein
MVASFSGPTPSPVSEEQLVRVAAEFLGAITRNPSAVSFGSFALETCVTLRHAIHVMNYRLYGYI